MILCSLAATEALAQSWSQWERDNAVSQHKAFLVIKQPGEGFCYVKQSYDDDKNKMELAFRGRNPAILMPFLRGIDGDAQYWVDGKPLRSVASSEISEAGYFELATEVVSSMKAGLILYVRVKPVGQPVTTQEFSLLGFTAAAKMLTSDECQKDGV
jgi:hypothetical protein